MRQFLFLEYNQPGMEWLDKEESPSITIIKAATPEDALMEWVDRDSRYCTEEHVQDEISHLQQNTKMPNKFPIEFMRNAMGVDIKMFEIKEEMSELPWTWMVKIAEEVTQPDLSEIED